MYTSLIKQIKENNEDFEFYPTTQEIVDKLSSKLKTVEYGYRNEVNSILDIGCGNGAFFEKLDKTGFNVSKKYGIEKSTILYQQLPKDVILIGSDFNEQTLIDKQVDAIFCNPPYSEYESWSEKIILQGNASIIALVIPERWKDCPRIKEAIKKRGYTTEILGNYSFENAERKARAKVDLLYLDTTKEFSSGRKYRESHSDPFDIWFDETFNISAKPISETWKNKEETQEEIKNELVKNGDTAEMLVELYNRDMEKLYNNYRALEKLDPEIFAELKVDVKKLKESLKIRLCGLKKVYWDMLFKRYDKITTRLTSKGKDRVLRRLNDNTSIDFTLQNIFMITMWIIQNTNTLLDEQLSDFFFTLCDSDSIQQYKSNKRWNEDDWRYVKDAVKNCHWKTKEERKENKYLKNIMLDYRIVIKGWSNFNFEYSELHLTEACIDFLNDLLAIAYNLGFVIKETIVGKWDNIKMDDWKNFDLHTVDGKLFANVKLYQNGNRHIKFCKEFMQKFNIEMARINGWVQDKEEATEELGFNRADVERFWGSNKKIEIEEGTKVLGIGDK